MDIARIKRKQAGSRPEIMPGGSKSIHNRLLIIKYLSGSPAVFSNESNADDSIRLEEALRLISTCASSRIPLVIDTGNAGTVMRFLTAYLARTEGKWLLTGSERMQQRSIGILVDALKEFDADI